jgi:hypothetical protein
MITTLKGRVRKGLIVPDATLDLPEGSEVTFHLEQYSGAANAGSDPTGDRSARLIAFLDEIELDRVTASVPPLPIESTKRESVYGDWANDV